MTEGGSVWDTGPQYPETSPENADGTSPSPAAPEDVTPETGSPVDLDAPASAERQPAAPVPPAPVVRRGRRPPGWWQRTLLGFPVWMVLAFLAVVVAVFVAIALSGDPGADGPDGLQTAESVVTTAPQLATTTPPPPATSAPATTVAAATPTVVFTIPDAPASVAQTTAVPPAPAPTSTPATAAPTTVPAAATLPPDGPVVTIIGRVGPCDFGSECLLAGFTIHNFNSQPTEFVCEFGDGSRYTFHFNRQEVERACATGDPTDSITIEVAGVRSATYVHP